MVSSTNSRATRNEDGEEQQPAQACAAPAGADLNEKLAPPSEGRAVRGRCTYELGPVIGKGNDGQVVRAVNLETGSRVALKIMQRRVNPDDNLSEGDYMKRVQSKHIVKVEEVFRRGDMEYIVMELAEMDMLELVNALGSIEEDVARHFFRHLVHGVDACHQAGVVHLDIKPDNLIIVDDETRNGCIKLTDFGLSALWEGPNGPIAFTKACGSNGYAPPEILKGEEPYDGRMADVWSCGVVLYACTQGNLPWDDACEECMEFLWFKQGKFEYPSNMSPGLVALLRKVLVCDPNCRATIEEIKQDEWFRRDEFDEEE